MIIFDTIKNLKEKAWKLEVISVLKWFYIKFNVSDRVNWRLQNLNKIIFQIKKRPLINTNLN